MDNSEPAALFDFRRQGVLVFLFLAPSLGKTVSRKEEAMKPIHKDALQGGSNREINMFLKGGIFAD